MALEITIFDSVNNEIVDDIKYQLFLQGHMYSHALDESIKPYLSIEGGAVNLSATALSYLQELEHGISPFTKINADKVDINKLAKWCISKGMAQSLSGSIAMAKLLVRRWKKEGYELEGAKAYSDTGKVDEAVKTAFDNNKEKHIGLLDSAVYGSLDTVFHKTKSGVV